MRALIYWEGKQRWLLSSRWRHNSERLATRPINSGRAVRWTRWPGIGLWNWWCKRRSLVVRKNEELLVRSQRLENIMTKVESISCPIIDSCDVFLESLTCRIYRSCVSVSSSKRDDASDGSWQKYSTSTSMPVLPDLSKEG